MCYEDKRLVSHNDDVHKIILIIIIIVFIERHIQQAVRGALQHSIAALSVIINIQVNYF